MPGTIKSVCVVWLLLVSVLFCSRLAGVRAVSICTNAHAGCHVLSLANLFDRVIQHSTRMHSITNDLHSEFEQYFLPSQNHVGRVSHNCHTSTIITPNGKGNAQRLAREELTRVILMLLVAWRDPLWHFHQSMSHQHDFNNFSSNKALQMSDMVHELRKGVEKVAEKMQKLGIIKTSVSKPAPPEAVQLADGARWHLMKDYDLLYCFRRDSNKIHNYLKLLKCRIVPEHGC
ncbi:prolactin isoform X1 [Takifugu rubripes]|uniref:Prolactin 2 n=1 Tax=Takifugu rubripes TaxID=31033 RepID=H2U4C4_TAKRU|nr:prolactin isoform X1 [Takifugu rubripes]XP_029681130.1 prolactin isoform X1 [Takifugu rubripes]|eukprot:XP_003972677.1 PREDICTED: prolactin-like [Takifugu rubripes]